MSKVYSRYDLPPKAASVAGERMRDTYKWTINDKGCKELVHDVDIDRQAEIESYADECDIKNIVARAAFDPTFAKSLAAAAMDGSDVDITNYPDNIHELKKMAEQAGKKIEELNKANKAKEEVKNQNEPE